MVAGDAYQTAVDRVDAAGTGFADRVADFETTELAAFETQMQAIRGDMARAGDAALSLIRLFTLLPAPVQTAGRILLRLWGRYV